MAMPGKSGALSVRLELQDRILYESAAGDLQCPVVIGRQSGCAWRVPAEETSVSKMHAEISLKHGRLWLRDLGSRNGVFVLGRKVAELRLTAGVSASIGQCRLCVEKIEDRRTARVLPYHRLERLNGEKAGTFCDITSDVFPIGAAVTDGMLCSSALVSKRHAEIMRKSDDSCWIRDLDSRNGTTVNGVPLKKNERMLRHRDVISAADVQFRFWDRTVDPYRNRLVFKICAALVTAAVTGTVYFAVQSVFPSAKAKLADASELEFREKFDEAAAVLDQATSARGAEYYRDEIERKRRELLIWKNTLDMWKSAKMDFTRRFWIDASAKLGSLLDSSVEKWGWNTTTAQAMKRDARHMKMLVDVFLSARSAIRGDFRENEHGREREALLVRLQDVESALADARWTAGLPTGKLREDMEEQRDELRALIADLGALSSLLSAIKAPPDADMKTTVGLAGVFPEIVHRIRNIAERSEKREARRSDEAKRIGRSFVSPVIVEEKCADFIPVLERFIEAQAVLEANLGFLVSCRYGDLKRELPFPSDQQCSLLPQFGELRRLMSDVNRRVNTSLRDSVSDQLGRLAKWKLESRGVPPVVAVFLDSEICEKVFSCDSLQGERPRSSRTVCAGRYDEVLGLEDFANFLKAFDVDRDYRADWAEAGREPAVVDAVKFYRQLDRFRDFLDDGDVAYLLTVETPEGNRLRTVAENASSLQEKRDLLIESWWNRQSDDRRSVIIARGLALALDTDGRFGSAECDELRSDLSRLKKEIAGLKAKIDADPDCVTDVRPRILEIGIPGMNNVNAWWDQEAKRRKAR